MATLDIAAEKFVSHQRAVAAFTALIAAATKLNGDAVRSVNLGRLDAIVEVGFTRGKLFVLKLPEIGAGSRVHWMPNYEFHPDEVVDLTFTPTNDALELLFYRRRGAA
ncbi:MAG: hypothetical protein JOZ38_02820 [Candidatus Eremiobacteraeota bacterium]|nr:hypothetical protein [Candidatus Eremiobacteraeota bacterium]